MTNTIKNVVVAHYRSYNERRYSLPWVCLMNADGSYDFSRRIGIYTGEKGEEGDLVVFDPIEGQVYGWGQKDYRKNRTEKNFCKWTGSEFVKCDKMGNEK